LASRHPILPPAPNKAIVVIEVLLRNGKALPRVMPKTRRLLLQPTGIICQ
jgi:hypothetical protein